MRYLPHTPAEIEQMLRVIDAPSIDALFEPIPTEARLNRPLAIEKALDEASLVDELQMLADKKSRGEDAELFGRRHLRSSRSGRGRSAAASQ